MNSYTTNHSVSFIEDSRLNPDDFIQAALNNNVADWDKLYENYDAATDWPTVHFYKELFQKYPNLRVILTVRSAESWYESFKNTVFKSFLKTQDITPDDPKYLFIKMCRDIPFNGILADPKQFNDKEKIIKLYNDHNEEVKAFIPAEQLYIMELGSGWEGLCKFLGKEIPEVPYPSNNSTKEYQDVVLSSSEWELDFVR